MRRSSKLGWEGFVAPLNSGPSYPESHATYSTPLLTESAVAKPVPHRGGGRRISVAKSRHVRRRRIIWLDDLARLQGRHTVWLFRIKAGNSSVRKCQNDVTAENRIAFKIVQQSENLLSPAGRRGDFQFGVTVTKKVNSIGAFLSHHQLGKPPKRIC